MSSSPICSGASKEESATQLKAVAGSFPSEPQADGTVPRSFWGAGCYKARRGWHSGLQYAVFLVLSFLSFKYYLQTGRPSMFWLVLFLAISVNASASNPAAHQSEHLLPQEQTLCESSECIDAASSILYNLHPNYTNIDLCTHFDQYVCGGWQERHDMRPDQGSIFTGTVMVEHVQSRLRHIMESPQTPDPADSDNFQKLRAAYDACLDESTIRKRGTKPLDDMLAGLAKVYPESSNKGVEDNLTDAVVYLVKAGTVALAVSSVHPDDRDPDSVTVFVMPPSEIGLPAKQYYNDTNLVADYKTMVEHVLGNMGIREPGSIVEFETKLASVTPDAATLADVTEYYNPLSVEEIQSLLPEVSFSGIISELAPPGYKGDRLIVGLPSYMKSLSDILGQTTRETVQHFLRWKVIQNYVDSIQDPKLKPLREFNNRLAGKDPEATGAVADVHQVA